MRKAALLLILFAAPAPALAGDPQDEVVAPPPALTAEEAIKRYHDRLSAVMRGARCSAATAVDEIVVCGRASGQRPEFEREPGEIVRHVNEPGAGVAALAAGGCDRLCNVGVRVNVVKVVTGAPRAIRRLLGKD